ncbi:MAG: hypothetical protein QOE38_178 [Thermoleophilaceae bacterium]|nr:hypothetical protein [Thermoleophilaceae bacterium]
MPLRPHIRWALLFLGGALISAFTIRQGIDPFDEGIALQAARRVAGGEVPYADFTWAYGPAWPYLLAGLFKVFGGASLLQWRVLRVVADASVALVVYALLRRRFEVPQWVALLGWLAAACAMAEPRSANPFPFALLFALLAIATVRRPLLAAVFIALAAAFRLDFALYGAAAVTVVLASDREWKPALRLLAVSAALSLVLYLPFLIDIGPAKLYQALIGTSLHDRNYWTLSFPLSYGGSISLRPHALKDVLDYYQPLLLVIGLAIAALIRKAGLALLVFGLGALSYLLSRTDEFHTQPLFVALAVLLPALAVRTRHRAVMVAAALVFALMLAEGVGNRLSALFRPPAMSEVHVAAADGVEAPPREAQALERVVADVDTLAPPGQPIYVAPRRSDLVTYSNSIVYVLADRDNAAGRDFGLVTSAAEQQAIVSRLRARRPRVVVRWTDPLSSKEEPNLRGRPSGSHVLDEYLASTYRPLERLYHYDVLVPR